MMLKIPGNRHPNRSPRRPFGIKPVQNIFFGAIAVADGRLIMAFHIAIA
jgi:hypothetical protein